MATTTGTVAPFVRKIYEMVDEPSTNPVVSWSITNNSFVVWNVSLFQTNLLPNFFKHNNFSSFVRQLNTYGFRKIDPDRFEFAHEGFLRGQKHLLKGISRKKSAYVHSNNTQSTQAQSSSVTSPAYVGNVELREEVERLKQDKNILMQELVQLQKLQQSTDNQVQSVGQRVQSMEQRQQQMMSFLSKAMQSPGFLNQFMQQPNESSKLMSGTGKKRRIPGHEEENLSSMNTNHSPDGKIVKFHSSMNEAAKAILQQILKMNTSSRVQASVKNSGSLLLDNLSSCGLDNSGYSSRSSTVILSEVQPSLEPSLFPVESGFSVGHPSSLISEDQSLICPVVKNDTTPEVDALNSGQDGIMSMFTEMHGILPERSNGVPEVSAAPEIGSLNCSSPTSSALKVIETDSICSDNDVAILTDNISRLPSVNDVFWEQFLSTSPLTGYVDEIDSSSLRSSMTKDEELSLQDNVWDKVQNMNALSEQMELLSSASHRM